MGSGAEGRFRRPPWALCGRLHDVVRSTARLEALMTLTDGVIPRVLVVDDEPSIVEALKLSLALKGYAVSTANDGPEALQQVQATRPHVVLLDINLPGMDGLAVLRHLRGLDPEVGVIMVSGIDDEATRQAALALGATDYLTKPMHLLSVERSVARLIIARVVREAVLRGRVQRGVGAHDPGACPRGLGGSAAMRPAAL